VTAFGFTFRRYNDYIIPNVRLYNLINHDLYMSLLRMRCIEPNR